MYVSKIEYRYYLLNKRWLARLEINRYGLEPKEFFKNGKWQLDDKLNLELNDAIMDYGDSSVFDYDEISEDQANKFIVSSLSFLEENQILSAKQCYLFGKDILYIAFEDISDIFVYHITEKSWSKRSNEGFWNSWDVSPELFLPITNEEAVKKIFAVDGLIEQMVSSIVGKESDNPTDQEKEIRKKLSGRAMEYLMFMDDED